MRSKEEVAERCASLRERRLKERKERFLSKCPRNCKWNKELRVKGSGKVGFCTCPIILDKVDREIFVCNDEDTAKRCNVFDSNLNESDVEDEFSEILRNPSRCGHEYPKLAVLIWFLQDVKPIKRPPLYKRLWYRFRNRE